MADPLHGFWVAVNGDNGHPLNITDKKGNPQLYKWKGLTFRPAAAIQFPIVARTPALALPPIFGRGFVHPPDNPIARAPAKGSFLPAKHVFQVDHRRAGKVDNDKREADNHGAGQVEKDNPSKATNQGAAEAERDISSETTDHGSSEVESDMSFQGVDLTVEAGNAAAAFSWSDPHPLFVIILVGADEVPYGIQKDLLCAHSSYFRNLFSGPEQSLEQIVKLADTEVAVFGCFQLFIFTGKVFDKLNGHEIPSYPVLMGLWRLATKLAMAPLRIAVLETMTERREHTGKIPGPPLLVQAWKDTEEGSGLRKMLLNWAAEHSRTGTASSEDFIDALPEHIVKAVTKTMGRMHLMSPSSPLKHKASFNNPVDVEFEQSKPAAKRRKSEGVVVKSNPQDEAYDSRPAAKKPRKSEPPRRPTQRRSTGTPSDVTVTPEQDLEACRHLINRMLTAPSYWTRYIKYFRDPVDPVRDNLENYTTVVKHPMDLKTIQNKMNANQYASAAEFEADVRQIFQNAYEFWQKEDVVFKECEEFENFFNRQFAQRHQKTGGSRVKAEALED